MQYINTNPVFFILNNAFQYNIHANKHELKINYGKIKFLKICELKAKALSDLVNICVVGPEIGQ